MAHEPVAPPRGDAASDSPGMISVNGVEWFFPTFFHHFEPYMDKPHPDAPDGFPNDGLLNIRMAYALNNSQNLSYVA
eukprot:SAG11_NODE_19284_length_470_cov_0.830189_2_plen_76_part_01